MIEKLCCSILITGFKKSLLISKTLTFEVLNCVADYKVRERRGEQNPLYLDSGKIPWQIGRYPQTEGEQVNHWPSVS